MTAVMRAGHFLAVQRHDAPMRQFADPLGEESLQLSLPVVFCLRHHLLAQV